MKTLLFTLVAGALTVAGRADVPWLDIGDVSRSAASTDEKTESLALAAGTESRPKTPLALFDSMCFLDELSNSLKVFDSRHPGACIIVR